MTSIGDKKVFHVFLPTKTVIPWESVERKTPREILGKPEPIPGGGSRLFGGMKHSAQPIKDTKTGKVYKSKSACGRALADEVGGSPEDHFVWYKLLNAFPDRFIEV